MLQVVDTQWKDHLYSLDHLKDGIGLRGYGQRDPLVEYKKESFALFQAMRERVDDEMLRYLWRLRPVVSDGGQPVAPHAAAPGHADHHEPRPGWRRPPRRSRRGPRPRRCPSRRRRVRPASAETTPRSGPSGTTGRRWAATTRAPAAAARSTRSATARSDHACALTFSTRSRPPRSALVVSGAAGWPAAPSNFPSH